MNASLTVYSPFTCSTSRSGITAYAYNSASQLAAIATNARSYDGNGNFSSSSEGWSLAYNAQDQTASISKPGGSATAASYHGIGQWERLTFGGTTFSTGQLGVNALTRSGAATDSFTRDPDGALQTLRNAGSYYYLTDGLGSVVSLTDSSGAEVNSYSYDPFGDPLTSSEQITNPWRFIGAHNYHTDSQTSLIKVGIRYYEPATGRWTQLDPIEDPVGNNYVYVGQGPINLIDPTGAFGLSDVSEFFDEVNERLGDIERPIRTGFRVASRIARSTGGRCVIGGLATVAVTRLVIRDARALAFSGAVGCVLGIIRRTP